MPAYNFQRQFGPALRAGTKTTTIRARRKDGRVPRVGQPFSAWHGLRTKSAELIFRGEIVKVETIRIVYRWNHGGIVLDGSPVPPAVALALALADGFANQEELFAWFLKTHGQDFTGHRITWRRHP